MMMLDDSSDDECGFYVSDRNFSESCARALSCNSDGDLDTFFTSSKSDNPVFTSSVKEEVVKEFLSADNDYSDGSPTVKESSLDALLDFHRKSLLVHEICSYIHDQSKHLSEFGSDLISLRSTLNTKTSTDSSLRSKFSDCREQTNHCRKAANLLCRMLTGTDPEKDESLLHELKFFEGLPCSSFMIDDVFLNPSTGQSWKFIGTFQKFENVSKNFMNQFMKFVDIIDVYRGSGDLKNICLNKKEYELANLTRSVLLLEDVAQRAIIELDKYEVATLGLGIAGILKNFYQCLCSFFKKLFPFSFFF